MEHGVAPARVRGLMLGTALGDALGLVREGLGPSTTAPRYGILPGWGVVSDDTEHMVMLAWAMGPPGAHTPIEVGARFGGQLLPWLATLPFGIGWATLRASLARLVGRRTGVFSAGNGPAMRAPLLGMHPEATWRRSAAEATARITHTDPRAIEAAVFVAEVAAGCLRATTRTSKARHVMLRGCAPDEPALHAAVTTALSMLDVAPAEAARALGNSGFAVHTAGVCTWALAGAQGPADAIARAIALGGDADTHAAIVGAWAGALWGEDALDAALLGRLGPWPYTRAALVTYADALTRGTQVPKPAWAKTMGLHVALFPVVIAHAVWRVFTRPLRWVCGLPPP